MCHTVLTYTQYDICTQHSPQGVVALVDTVCAHTTVLRCLRVASSAEVFLRSAGAQQIAAATDAVSFTTAHPYRVVLRGMYDMRL